MATAPIVASRVIRSLCAPVHTSIPSSTSAAAVSSSVAVVQTTKLYRRQSVSSFSFLRQQRHTQQQQQPHRISSYSTNLCRTFSTSAMPAGPVPAGKDGVNYDPGIDDCA
jgi:hypothetical protein